MIIIGIALHCCTVKSVMLHISRFASDLKNQNTTLLLHIFYYYYCCCCSSAIIMYYLATTFTVMMMMMMTTMTLATLLAWVFSQMDSIFAEIAQRRIEWLGWLRSWRNLKKKILDSNFYLSLSRVACPSKKPFTTPPPQCYPSLYFKAILCSIFLIESFCRYIKNTKGRNTKKSKIRHMSNSTLKNSHIDQGLAKKKNHIVFFSVYKKCWKRVHLTNTLPFHVFFCSFTHFLLV